MQYFFRCLALGLAFVSQVHGQTAKSAQQLAVLINASRQAHYARLDHLARQLPEAHAATLDHLAAALAGQARSADDKARLIFAWIAYHVAYDVAGAHRT
jgi:hypothetical protein